jgi:tryptophan-associated transmembrane protein
MPIDASKPTPLRLWGFLLTVCGGVLVAFGSLQVWVTATVNGQANPISPRWPGIDLPEGLVALACGIVLIVGILALRMVKANAKRVVAILLIVAGVIAFAVAGVVAVTATSRFADAQTAAERVASSEHIPVATALKTVSGHLTVSVGIGAFATVLGGIIGAIGGVLSLALVVRRPDDADDGPATEPDHTAESG